MERHVRSGASTTGTRPSRLPVGRLLLVLSAGVAALAGLDAALLRLGLAAPVDATTLADAHGVLMVYGFLGTAITLERAVALQAGAGRANRWAYAAPLFSGVGAITLVLQATAVPVPAGRLVPGLAWTASMLLLLAIYLRIWQRQESFSVLVSVLGAFAGLGGIALWTRGVEAAVVVPWWTTLLILTIVGERLELARLTFGARGVEPRVVGEAAGLVGTLVLTLVAPAVGYPLLGLVLAILVVDVASHDTARHTLRSPGLPRLMATCLLTGYAWALVAAGVWVVGGPALAGYRYDLVVHAVTIGFALSMVLAHAPVIIPAIIRRPLPYHPAMWAVWLLLQAGLVARLLAGARDAAGWWQLGGALNVVAVLAFLAVTVTAVATASRRTRGERGTR